MVRLSESSKGSFVGVPSGMVTWNICGLSKLVVSIKKVISRNARSTIAVRSTRVDILLRGIFPEVFSGDELSSAMFFKDLVYKSVD